ncbi:MAG: septum site-determining protein MinC [Chloroflexi bacterium RIFOXYC12_FULL_59_14]|nr:MAG: septum site-determining protein MinC [Chloroflexi bacterium RIFOXYC12_FULL_59_14]
MEYAVTKTSMTDPNSLVQIKGLRDGLLVSLGNASWDDLRAALMEQIETRQSFFRGARVAIDVGGQIFHVNELSELRDTLSERGVNLWAVVSESPTTEKTAQLLGLATRISKPRPQEMTRPPAEEIGEAAAMWIGRTLRSGTRIEFPGNIVVLGDVNPGAEVIADGSILVWGRVRGVAHAGANGDQSAVVCGLDLSAGQIRIAGAATIPPALSKVEVSERSGEVRPEKISLKDGILQMEPWQANQS